MPQLTPYRLFISHAWDHNKNYYRLIELLEQTPFFKFHNYSVPAHDPLDTKFSLKRKLTDQMKPAQVVLVLAGMYANNREWIQYEIAEAKRMSKPIIAVRPWAQKRVPLGLQQVANRVHGFNATPIVSSIRYLA